MINIARLVAAATAALAVPAQAATLSAIAQVDYSALVRFNTGDAALPGVDVTSSPSIPIPTLSSALAAADALNETGQTTIIAGASAADPSQFTSFDRTTRNGGTEGGDARTSFFTYGIRVADEVPATGGSLVEVGWSGTTSSQAQITTDPHAAAAQVNRFNARTFEFENLSVSDSAFFTITAELDLTAIALVTGADALARSTVALGLAFSSADPLAISFAPLMPFLPVESTSGPGAATSFGRSTDPSGTGMVGLSALASATGGDPLGTESASLDLSDRVVLGVTLAPGQVLSMTMELTGATVAEVNPRVAPVPLPAGLPLMAAGLAALGWLGRRRKAA